MLTRLRRALTRKTPLRWYLAHKLSRMQLIQYAVDRLAARTYLEIGVDKGQSFSVIRAPIKIGVDPIAPRPAIEAETQRPGSSYFQVTSDDFFARDAPIVLATVVDVVFIDGLHTFGQTFRDIQHSLQYLNPGGVVLVHDCLPASRQEACVAESFDDARRLNGPDWNGVWTGDTWKSIVAVRAGHVAGDACVLECDRGVGVVRHRVKQPPLATAMAEIEGLDYETLISDPTKWIGLCRPVQLRRILSELRLARRS
jgi:hypothetical protein